MILHIPQVFVIDDDFMRIKEFSIRMSRSNFLPSICFFPRKEKYLKKKLYVPRIWIWDVLPMIFEQSKNQKKAAVIHSSSQP